MVWEIYRQRPRAMQHGLSIAANSLFRFSDELVSQMGLKPGSRIYLLYDPATGRMGLRVAPDDAEGAALCSYYSNAMHLAARKFVETYKIKPGRYRAIFNPDEDLYVCERAS